MAITEPISLPSERFVRLRPAPRSVVSVNESSFTLEQQAYAWPGQAWAVQVEVIELDNAADAGAWEAFFLKCNGRERRFLMGDPLRAAPQGSANGTPVLDGAHSARAQIISTRGWAASQAGAMKVGDLIQLGSGVDSHLHKVLADVDADGSGNADIDIWPGLRADYSDGEALVLTSPKGIWRLGRNVNPYDINAPTLYGFKFQAIEAI